VLRNEGNTLDGLPQSLTHSLFLNQLAEFGTNTASAATAIACPRFGFSRLAISLAKEIAASRCL
jgi:hypothetical protein